MAIPKLIDELTIPSQTKTWSKLCVSTLPKNFFKKITPPHGTPPSLVHYPYHSCLSPATMEFYVVYMSTGNQANQGKA